jgi:antiviral helicase SKI2
VKAANMKNSISEALAQLHLAEESATDDVIDDILERTAPHSQPRPALEELKKQLEKKYLTPSQTFSTEWLNRLQQ